MAHGIYRTKTEAKAAIKNLEKRTGVKPRLKVVTRYILVAK